jgi:hypothetical protein
MLLPKPLILNMMHNNQHNHEEKKPLLSHNDSYNIQDDERELDESIPITQSQPSSIQGAAQHDFSEIFVHQGKVFYPCTSHRNHRIRLGID